MDHEVREHGVRVLLVEPAYTSTGFDANVVQPDTPLPVYAQQRHIAGQVVAAGLKDGDDPATVAKVIVAAATTEHDTRRTACDSLSEKTRGSHVPPRAAPP